MWFHSYAKCDNNRARKKFEQYLQKVRKQFFFDTVVLYHGLAIKNKDFIFHSKL